MKKILSFDGVELSVGMKIYYVPNIEQSLDIHVRELNEITFIPILYPINRIKLDNHPHYIVLNERCIALEKVIETCFASYDAAKKESIRRMGELVVYHNEQIQGLMRHIMLVNASDKSLNEFTEI